MLRTLSPSFEALIMSSLLSANTFKKIVNAVSANIERGRTETVVYSAEAVNTRGRFIIRRSPGRVCFRRSSRGRKIVIKRHIICQYEGNVCNYCDKSENFVKLCLCRIAIEGNGQFMKPQSFGALNREILHWGACLINPVATLKSTGHDFVAR